MMKTVQFVFSLLCLILFPQTAVSVRRGYSLGFQLHSIAGPRAGWLDFNEPVLSQLDRNFTVSFWMRFYSMGYPFGITSETDVNYFNPVWYSDGIAFGKYWSIPTDVFEWFHVAVTADTENGLRLVVNGDLVTQLPPDPSFTLQKSPRMSLHFGDHLYTFQHQVVTVGQQNGFMGEMDEFGIWSRALSIDEIRTELVENSLSKVKVSQDPALLIYYNMEVDCDLADIEVSGITETSTCSVVGQDRIVPNLGMAGHQYDLLLGRLNNDFGHGNGYVITGSPPGTPVHPWSMPLPARSTPHSDFTLEQLETPSVYYALTGSSRIPILLNDSVVFVLQHAPRQGSLFASNASADPLTPGQAVSAAEVFYLPPTNGSLFTDPDWFTLNVTGVGVHQVHIWPYLKPRFLDQGANDQHEVTITEDSGNFMFITGLATYYARPPGPLHATVSPSLRAAQPVLYLYKASTNRSQRFTRVTDKMPTTGFYPGGPLYYIPVENEFGMYYDVLEFVALDPRSGLAADEVVRIDVHVRAVNDLPVAHSSTSTVSEDNNGTVISLGASDFEQNSIGIMISELPRKGDLYRKNPDGSWEKIEEPYTYYKFWDIEEQYAWEIVKVSSFWSSPPGFKTHPMTLLGRPNCYGKYGDCQFDSRRPDYLVDDIVTVNYNYFRSSSPVYVAATVRGVEDLGGDIKNYTVQVMQMLKWNGTDYLDCYMTGNNYPSECNETEYLVKGAHNYLTDLPYDAFRDSENLAWAPLNPSYTPGVVIDGGPQSAAFGRQYEFRNHSPSDYYDNNTPRYDEFIEFKTHHPGYIVDMEIGESRGGGAITSVKVMNPEGTWDVIYQGDALKAEHAKTTQVGVFHWFNQPVCRPFYPAQHFRLELDTSTETGIGDYNFIDYVKVFSAKTSQSAALVFASNEVLYVPHVNAEGVDSFSFQATDCGGDRLRSTDKARVELNILPVPDLPRANVALVSSVGALDVTGSTPRLGVPSGKTASIRVDMVDVDVGDWINMTITRLPDAKVATFVRQHPNVVPHNTEILEEGGVIQGPYERRGGVSSVTFNAMGAECQVLQAPISLFEFEIIDSQGHRVVEKLEVELDCTQLPERFEFWEVTKGGKNLSTALAAMGLILALFAAYFNFRYRRIPIVRMTSPRLNLVICFGCALVYMFLFLSGQRISENPDCDPLNYVSDLVCGTDPCCTALQWNRCILPMIFVSCGTSLVFAILIGKTARIIRLLMAKDLKKRKISDSRVVVNSLVGLSPVVVLLASWLVTNPPRVEFSVVGRTVDVEHQEVVHSLALLCTSEQATTFESLLIGYIGVAVASGAVQAYQVRNVHIRQANDSKGIAVAVYNIFLMGSITLAVQYTVQDIGPKHVLSSVLIFSSTTIIIVALFSVRMYEVLNGVTKVGTTVETHQLNNSTKDQYGSLRMSRQSRHSANGDDEGLELA